MENKNTTKDQGLYSVEELAKILGKSPKTISNTLYARGFKRIKCIDRVAYYSKAHLDALSNAPARQKPAEVYYIYQSKINIQ